MKAPDLETAFAEFIGRHRLLDSVDHLIVAVSGGIDSMVLLRLLRGHVRDTPVRLALAHVNHKLRAGESDGDEEFVRRTANEMGIMCHVRSGGGAGQIGTGFSLQERARAERYAFFESLKGSGGGTRLATAHNRDDNAETLLLNFLRGSGVHGLTGIPVVGSDGYVVRPLLFAARRDIREYACAQGIPYREDSSNAASKYTRNLLRNELIPEIESRINPGLKNTLVRTSELFNDLESFLHAEVEKVLHDIVANRTTTETLVSVPRTNRYHRFLRESALHELSRRFNPRGVQYAQIRTLMKMLEAPSGSSCTVAGDFHAYRDRDVLTLTNGSPRSPFLFPVDPDDSYQFGDFSFSSSRPDEVLLGRSRFEEYVDAGTLGSRLFLRSWNDGDWFMPIGMGAKKKVSDFFIDRKVPVTEKQRIPLLVSDDEIVWICGYRLDDRFKVTPGTRSVLKLSYTPSAP